MADPIGVFKAYDVRGLVPAELDEPLARAIGGAFAAEVVNGAGDTTVVVAHDMRVSSPGLAAAFADGVRDAGTDVVAIGLASTDMLYLASGQLGIPGAMITASHNPAGYNGIKMCRSQAVAMSELTGLGAIRDRVAAGGTAQPTSPRRGAWEHRDMLTSYATHLHDLVTVRGRPLRIVVDAGNGMAGLTAPAVLGPLDVELEPLYFELDGSFPHHDANPLDPANLVDLQRAVVASGADVGLAFDGDADRCFVVDEKGSTISASALTALIAVRQLARHPGARVVHNLITSRAVPEVIERHGGVPVRTRVGHSLIKATMADTQAIFGGEHSGHFYFRDFWYADSGMLAALHLLAELAAGDQSLSALVGGFDPYSASGEVNERVDDVPRVLRAIEALHADRDDVRLDRLDGLTVIGEDWWFNVRASNTEPVLRLNVEADSAATMADKRDEVLSLMRSSR